MLRLLNASMSLLDRITLLGSVERNGAQLNSSSISTDSTVIKRYRALFILCALMLINSKPS